MIPLSAEAKTAALKLRLITKGQGTCVTDPSPALMLVCQFLQGESHIFFPLLYSVSKEFEYFCFLIINPLPQFCLKFITIKIFIQSNHSQIQTAAAPPAAQAIANGPKGAQDNALVAAPAAAPTAALQPFTAIFVPTFAVIFAQWRQKVRSHLKPSFL